MRGMLRNIVFVAVGLSAAVPQVQSPPPIAGAVAHVDSRDVPTLILRITNLSDVGLQTVDAQVQIGDRLVRKSWNAETPLGTGGTGEIVLAPLGTERSLPVSLRFAVFADGTVAGDPAEVARLQVVSISLSDDLVAWREVLSRVPGMANAEAVRVLRDALEARLTAQPADVSGVRRLVEVWLREERAPGFFSSMARTEVATIDVRLRAPGPIAAAARRAPGPRPQNDLKTLVSAVTTAGVVREFTASVKNERTVPLEAWAVVLSDVRTGRPLRALAHDTARDVPNGQAPASIPPSGSRVVGTYQPEADLSGDVRAHLEFVMWQDLTWQGYQGNRQQTLANRERLAQEYEFFIPSLRAAAALPPDQALARLSARQAEFKAGPLARQSAGLQPQLDQWARVVATSPDGLSAQLSAHAATLELARPSLLRHRAQ